MQYGTDGRIVKLGRSISNQVIRPVPISDAASLVGRAAHEDQEGDENAKERKAEKRSRVYTEL